MTELYAYGALANTDIRLSDVFTHSELADVRQRLAYDEPHLKTAQARAMAALGQGEGLSEIGAETAKPEARWRGQMRAVMGALALLARPPIVR